MQDNLEEYFPYIDEEGNILGVITRGQAHNGSKLLHPVVHLHIFNSQGELFLQLRPEWKDIQPSKWDTACGGHVNLGEDVTTALQREVKEELNIEDFSPTELGHYVFESLMKQELIYSFKAIYNIPISINKEELADGKFWTMQEIHENLGKGIFTPNFESEYKRYFANEQKNK